MIVGLTGGYCAGKDTVARFLAARGLRILDVDSLGHEALAQKADEVIARFGESVRAADGMVDRRAIGKLVFSDPTALARLEAIVHPVMVKKAEAIAAAHIGELVINAAILHHMGLHALCDAVICVTAPLPIRVLRGIRRDRLSFQEALARARSQHKVRAQCNASGVDTYYVRNRGGAHSLERRVAGVLRQMQREWSSGPTKGRYSGPTRG